MAEFRSGGRQRLEIDVSVSIPEDFEDSGVMEQAKLALLAARSRLLEITGARSLTSAISLRPIKRARARISRRRLTPWQYPGNI